MLAVLQRELRVEARRQASYRVRLLSGGITFGVLLWMWAADMLLPGKGRVGFAVLDASVFLLIWIVVPLATCDCISREAREGTLGLLGLTRLSCGAIILAKVLSRVIRIATWLLASLPVLLVVILLGGVTWREPVNALLINASAVAFALAAGILASVLAREWGRVVALACCFSLLAALLHGLLLFSGTSFLLCGDSRLGWIVRGWTVAPFRSWVTVSAGLKDIWLYAGAPGTVLAEWATWLGAWVLFCGLIGLRIAGRLGARAIKRAWVDQPRSERSQRWADAFWKPKYFTSVLRSRLRAMLDRNPIGWLHAQSAEARITKWLWLAVVIVAVSQFPPPFGRNYVGFCTLLLVGIVISMAYTAAASFLRERQNGAMELLLVTPLKPVEIIHGRIRGIYGTYVPAGLYLLFSYFLLGSMTMNVPYWFPPYVLAYQTIARILGKAALVGCVVMPIFGLSQSMKRRSVLAAWSMTLLIGFGVPCVLFSLDAVVGGWLRGAGSFFLIYLGIVYLSSYGNLLGQLTRREFTMIE